MVGEKLMKYTFEKRKLAKDGKTWSSKKGSDKLLDLSYFNKVVKKGDCYENKDFEGAAQAMADDNDAYYEYYGQYDDDADALLDDLYDDALLEFEVAKVNLEMAKRMKRLNQ